MRSQPRPLKDADLSGVETVFTDVDGTLTSGHRLKSSTIGTLESLRDSGLRTVLVTGRPAGWGECWARTLPVDAVIVENGALTFVRNHRGTLTKVYAQPESVRLRNRKKLQAAVALAMRKVKGARLSMDSAYTEVDLAIDYNESVHLGQKAAGALEAILTAKGIQAVRSSVHVNCWIGSFDKLTTVKKWISREYSVGLLKEDLRFVYAGDSFNDAPMFAAFALSVGVANVLDVLEQMDAAPKYITRQREGAGFEELTDAILRARAVRRVAQ
jgi:HAD superfamily hydrolase (TIGR01484 family)